MTILRQPSATRDAIDPRRPSSWPRPAAASTGARRIAVVERQRLVAEDIAQAFAAMGAQVVGIAWRPEDALALIAGAGRLDGAVLDLDLRDGASLTVADELARRGVPFVFLTSWDPCPVPDRHAHVIRCEKPLDADRIVPLLLG